MERTSTWELADRVHSLAIRLLRRVRAADAESRLTASRLSALSVLVHAGPMPLGGLAAAEQVTPATMSRLVTALEGEGLVARVRDEADGRRVWVEAMPAGRQALREARDRRVERMSGLLAVIGPGRRGAVLDAVEILEAALAQANERRLD